MPPATASPTLPSMGLLALALVLLAGIVYANAIDHPFLYDDGPLVLNNPEIRSLSNVPAMLGISDDGFTVRGRWTREVTHALEYALVGEDPKLYHATNIVLHAAVAVLLFVLLAGVSGDRMLAWWAAAIFAVHPLATEVVAHVSGRRGLLAALFSLGALMMLMGQVRRGGWWRGALAFVLLYLAVFSKEMALLTPAAFVLLHLYWSWNRQPDPARSTGLLRRAWGLILEQRTLYAALALVSLGLAAAILLASDTIGGLRGSPGFYEASGHGLGFVDRARLWGLGIRLLLVPVGQSVDYSYDALHLVGRGVTLLGAVDLAILLAAAVATVVGLRRRWWVGFAGVWFVIFFAPHLGIIPWHEIFAERFLYVPSMGVATALAAGGLALVRRLGPRTAAGWQAAAAAGLVILAALGTGTVLRNRVWSDSMVLWADAAERYPNCARARKGVADEHIADARPDLAQEHYAAAAEILPLLVEARLGVGLSLAAKMRLPQARAVIDEVLADWPHHPRALNLKGYVEEAMGNIGAARSAYEQALEEDPTFTESYNNLAKLHAMEGDLEGAVALYERALEQDPAFLPALVNLAAVYRKGFGDEARADELEARAKMLRRLR